MSAPLQVQTLNFLCATTARHKRGMVKKSDETPAAQAIIAAQSARLERLRRLMGLSLIHAANLAGVTRFTWSRMEKAGARIDAVALGRFLREVKMPAEYVISGGYAGLPPELVRDLIRDEQKSHDAPAVARGEAGHIAEPLDT